MSENKIVVLSQWAAANNVLEVTAKLWARHGHLPGAYQSGSPTATRQTWLLPLDTPVPVRLRGAASGPRSNKAFRPD